MKPSELKEGEHLTIQRGGQAYVTFLREYSILMFVVSSPDADIGSEESAQKQIVAQYQSPAAELLADDLYERLID